MPTTVVPGFLPSMSGFHFPNSFPPVPIRTITVPLVGEIPIGDASGGLCGGMVFAVRDLFEASRNIPATTDPPSPGSALFNFLVDRLLVSFDIPWGVGKYYVWMGLPDQDDGFSQGVAQRTIQDEWPQIRADLDAGVLSPLGLVTIQSGKLTDLKLNHQVLAYGYALDEGNAILTIRIYDPNRPNDDSAQLNVSLNALSFQCPGGPPVRAFFRTKYTTPDTITI